MSRNAYARIPDDEDYASPVSDEPYLEILHKSLPATPWYSAKNLLRLTALASVIVLSFCIPALSAADTEVQPRPSQNLCKRLIVHNFDNAWGFGSEFSIFLHAAALGPRIGYIVIANTRKWIYGDLSEFWVPVPPPSGCVLPPNALDTSHSKWFGYGADWGTHDRIVMWRDQPQLRMLDELVRNYSIDTRKTAELREREKLYKLMTDRLVLPYGESVPEGVLPAFREQASTLNRVWVPNARMQAQIDRLAERIGVLGRERRRGHMRPVIAVQIRLGDKKTEQKDVLDAGSHMAFDDLSVYFDACHLALNLLYTPSVSPSPHKFKPPAANGTKPLLVVMSAEAGIVEKLQALDKKSEFEIILSPSLEGELTAAQQEEYTRIFFPPPKTEIPSNLTTLSASTTPAVTTTPSTRTTLPSTASLPTTRPADSNHVTRERQRRWQQGMLYQASHGLRLALTRQLIAELTVYARMTDGFVVSGNSNLGRLAQLLAGEEGAVSRNGRAERVRSIDVPFYPTLYRAAIFPPEPK
ncbi:hypothetical protein AURDEDRAFT_112281 [Auricularia subglabra TFB-10046 SS5]|nr:hypothetical protein AURDEDRAFT_112281 [Auricularia subglabra TFB-10046 SS5]